VEYKIQLLRKVALEIAVNDDFLEPTVETILHVARTSPEGNVGDGKVFVLPMDEAVRIGETTQGPEAI
jgi:nitrogen regulatory protein P-II 1